MQYIIFDTDDQPIAITTPGGAYPKNRPPAQSTIDDAGGAYAKPINEVPAAVIEEFHRRKMNNRPLKSPKRRRAGGHGYTGGDGFTPIH